MRKLTHEEQVETIAKINPDIKVLGAIIGNKTPVLCECRICGHKWEPKPEKLKSGRGCPECGKIKRAEDKRKSHEEIVSELKQKRPDVTLLERVDTGTHTKANFQCNVCGRVWDPIVSSVLRGVNHCPSCSKKKEKMTHEEHVAAITEKNPNVEVLSIIKNSRSKIKCLCRTCGNVFDTYPRRLKGGHGCPRCAKFGYDQTGPGVLYILADNPYKPSRLKIGVTKDLEARLKQLKRTTPFSIFQLRCYHFAEGGDALLLERDAHRKFAAYNCGVNGFNGATEWFWYKEEIIQFLDEAVDTGTSVVL